MVPTGRPSHVARCACAQSSTTASAVPPGNRQDGRHVGRLPVEMHGHERSGARRDRRLDCRRVDGQALGIDVREDRPRARHHDGERRVRRRQRARHHLVSGADAERAQGQRQRVGPGRDADRRAVPEAAASSCSKASSSGPRMNQPRSSTRAIASSIAARSSASFSERNGTAAHETVLVEIQAVVVDGAGQALAQRRPAAPSPASP